MYCLFGTSLLLADLPLSQVYLKQHSNRIPLGATVYTRDSLTVTALTDTDGTAFYDNN